MPSVTKHKNFYFTDYIAIIFAILFTPLLIIRSTTPELVQLSSDVPIYTDKYFKQVKAPMIMGNMNQYIEGRYYNIPHFLIPGYSKSFNQSFIDAVAFVGLQKEMLYSQRLLGLKYKTPYTQYRMLLTNTTRQDDAEHQSLWKNQTYYFSNYTNCSAPINYMYQDNETGSVIGITTERQVFLMNNQLHLVFSSDSFKKIYDNVNEKMQIQDIILLRTYIYKESVLITVEGILNDKSKILILHKLNLVGQTIFARVYNFGTGEDKSDIILQEINVDELDLDDLTVNKDDQLIQDGSKIEYGNLKYLRRAVDYQIESKHNELSNIFIVPKDNEFGVSIIVIKHKNQYHIINNEEGQHIVTFTIANGVSLYTDKDMLYTVFISDTSEQDSKSANKKIYQKFDIISLQISGDETKQMSVQLNFIQYASEEHTAIERKMRTNIDNLKPTPMVIVQPVVFTDLRGKKQIIMLTPNGMLLSINALNGYKNWVKSVDEFIASTINAHLSIQSLQNQQIIILQIGLNTEIFNTKSGHPLGKFMNDKDIQLYDTQKESYNDVDANVQQQIIVERMHPYGNKKAIVLVRGKSSDVITLGQSGVALTNFWERVMLVSLVSFIVAIILRLFVNTMYVKE